MKNLRKLFAMLLALGLILALCVPAYAGETAKTGSVTVNNGENGNIYELYQILIPEGEGYKAAEGWAGKVKVENGVTSVNFGGEVPNGPFSASRSQVKPSWAFWSMPNPSLQQEQPK